MVQLEDGADILKEKSGTDIWVKLSKIEFRESQRISDRSERLLMAVVVKNVRMNYAVII